jgi:iron complex transport system substrate-binding protein
MQFRLDTLRHWFFFGHGRQECRSYNTRRVGTPFLASVAPFFSVVCLILALGVFPVAAQDGATPACVTDFDPAVDLFPDKSEVEYASGFSIEYANHYKILTVSNPWPGATEADSSQYVLVQCGTPAPEGFDEATVIEIPAARMIAMSTTYLPHIVQLGLLDRLVGVDSLMFANTPEVIARGEAGELVEIGFGSTVNVEVTLDAEPDLVMTFGSGSPDFDAHPVLIEAGIPVVLNGDWTETTPLGRTEWIKFTAAFFNAEAQANEVFGEEAGRYLALAELTAAIPQEERPTVLWSSFFSDSWAIPGGQSYIARLLDDAGGRLILSDSPEAAEQTGSALFDFETVYDAGIDAEYWVPIAFGVSDLASFVATDDRYADFAAVESGNVWNNDKRANANGGWDYFETGVTNPSGVLADLIAILHPDLLPNHETIYFRNLE